MNTEKTDGKGQENLLRNAENSEPSAWDLRQEWRSAYNTCKQIRTHVAKLQDGRHTPLSDNGIELILAEHKKLTDRMKEIEALFKIRKLAL